MTSLYEWLASTNDGARALAVSRLRYQVLKVLHRSLREAGVTQADLAKRLGVRKSAVNQVFRGDGNLRVATIAEYLHALGFEAVLRTAVYGAQRANAVREMQLEWRASRSLRESVVARSAIDERPSIEHVEWRSAGRSSRHQLTATSAR